MKTRIIVLAAGKGKRMKQDIPKALTLLNGVPLVRYVAKAVEDSGVDPKPLFVVSSQTEPVLKEMFGSSWEYVVQHESLGTGHAVKTAHEALQGKADTVMVFYSDQPFLRAATIRKLQARHRKTGAMLSLATVTVPDFSDWRESLADFGRVIRDARGTIVDIVERKDATPEILRIREVNPSYFCFNAEWLWYNLDKLTDNNAQREYYLTDLVRIAIEGGAPIASLDISPLESMGVNTPQQLELARTLI